MSKYRSGSLGLFNGLLFVMSLNIAPLASAQEVIVLSGFDEITRWMKDENWWGEDQREEQLQVPRILIAGISPRWAIEASNLEVADKKELFYRAMLPMVLHANQLVLDRREKLRAISSALDSGKGMTAEELTSMRHLAKLLRIKGEDQLALLDATDAAWLGIMDTALYRLDIIPAGLVLGQAAYESGYGTSRFASQGNALFGQWTYGGNGLLPEQQRVDLGDHRIAAYEWPFDSVRAYFLNLNTHPAYEDFRRLRAEQRATAKQLNSMALADGLIAYSERGQAYVDTLKGIMRVNNLTIADDAVFRDEPLRFFLGAESPEQALELKAELARMRASGELEEIIERMRLD
ncbi:hypothetical protein A3709_05260 [Halioglobus sp. HI00S01]|uniref:glucosaminidase domain-containing protein n=1 Tax=Halioglobus sp. HI00S01 TaxID=1822214 RepID=UPI0007C2B5C4|nr:glucosaminidase domain-containing protein [Halioglobus sp. HI00S01]KZX56511.1 hypothetical protein A3709_05260 [Halioglobus sp. HI00S01]